ncbi:hypothetical protein [Bifidobacterium xylocopae]|uniref:Uncharacterized protein n=1 Tax=Bifidobacterium xylocopae TaxID=2493119 RepID=A0A366KDZ7_9BIFI|nr:hypothetical protein [Bifidobacterium xylocopae]RBP99418.1 hypothetical protein CRD59_04275 [Bifidobacterium xylocopae]
MQTRTGSGAHARGRFPSRRKARVRSCILLLCAAASVLSGCSSPVAIQRMDPQGGQSVLSPCDRAVADARTYDRRTADPWFASAAGARLQEPAAAAQAWHEVAIACPARFGEAVNRSALAWMTANRRARAGGASALMPADPQALTLQALQELPSAARLLGPTQLAQAARAEDRAGFSLIVLAGRRQSGGTTLLAVGDRHHAAAQSLASADPAGDPRQAVYSSKDLLQHPDSMTDPSNGLEAPTESVVEMNCARGLIQAFQGFVTTAAKEGMEAEDEGGAQGRPGAPGLADGKQPGSRNPVHEQRQALGTLALMATAHAYTALDEGYPALPQALLQEVPNS